MEQKSWLVMTAGQFSVYDADTVLCTLGGAVAQEVERSAYNRKVAGLIDRWNSPMRGM